jgi:hypothetical protein
VNLQDNLVLELSKTGSAIASSSCGTTVLQTNTWYFIAATYDSSAKTVHLYINGVDDGATVYSGTVPASLFINTSEHVVIGDTVNGSFANFNGQIDDVRIYNRALSAAEIAALYGGGCSNPAGNAGAIMYNNAFSVMQYCNGSAWIPMAQP